MAPKYCYIQLTPLPKIPKDETKAEKDVRLRWIQDEVNAFLKWSGSEKESAALTIATGFPTKFLVQYSYRPEGSKDPWDRALDYFIQDIFNACVYGGQNAVVDGQKFTGRARWRRKIKGHKKWKTNLGLDFGGNKETPVGEGHTADWIALLVMLACIMGPIVLVLLAAATLASVK